MPTPPDLTAEGYSLVLRATGNDDGLDYLTYRSIPATPTPIPTPTPTPTVARGLQAAFQYGAWPAGQTWQAAAKTLGCTLLRHWAVIPNGALVGGAGDNQATIVKLIAQAYASGVSSIPVITPNQGQAYSTPFLPAASLSAWLTQWLQAVQAACGGASLEKVFPFGVECGNELFVFNQYWPGKHSEILGFVQTCNAVLNSFGVKTLAPSWNGTNLAQMQPLYAPLLPYVSGLPQHCYSPTPGAYLSSVAKWTGPQYLLLQTELGSHQAGSGSAIAAPGRTQAFQESKQAGCIVLVDTPSRVDSSDEGPCGLVNGDGTQNPPYWDAWLATM